MPSKTLVITSCCKEKLDHAAPARDLYQGKLFKLVKQYAEENNFDWRILSAKHGLISPEQVIEPYDLQITGRAQIDPLQETVLPALAAIWDNYEKIIVILGAQYLKVINPILQCQGKWKMASNVQVEVMHDERGIGGLMQQVNRRINDARGAFDRKVADAINAAGQPGHFTRTHHPELCKPCKHRDRSFDAKRKCGLGNGETNPASTPCDYCCKWDNEELPDKFEPEEKPMAEQPKNPETKKDEPEESEFGRICGGCHKPIKPSTKNMVQDPHTKEWFHAEHYGQDERHQKTSEDKYECIACGEEFPEADMHEDRDGERWCKKCWAVEHPRKKRAKKPQEPVPLISKVLRFKGTWIYLDKSHLSELDIFALGGIMRAYAIKGCDHAGPTKDELIDAILEAPVGGVMGEEVEGKTTPLQEELDLYPGLKAVCDACHQPIYRDQQVMVQGSMTPALPFHAECHPKREILYHCAFDCAKFKECSVRYVENCKEFASKVTKDEQVELGVIKQALTEKGLALAGQRLYQIFAMHAAQIAPLLSKEEQVEMNTLAEALSIE